MNGRVKRISCHGLSLTGWEGDCQEAKGIGYEKLQHSIIVRTQIKDLLHKNHVKNKSMPNIFVNSERLRIKICRVNVRSQGFFIIENKKDLGKSIESPTLWSSSSSCI